MHSLDIESRLQVLAEKIRLKMKQTPVAPNGVFALGSWMYQNLQNMDFELLQELEQMEGEVQANKWLTSVLVSTKRFISEDGHTLSEVRA